MQNHPGVFIVLEGSDGSGKGTQFRLLNERLKAVGHDVVVFDFPRYDQPSSHFVKRYLNGDYGPASEVSPYTASIFYALDRYEASPQIKQAIDKGKVVVANRYVGSNMAHQGAKFTTTHEQRGFFLWAEALEYQLLGISRPNINLFLKVPADISFELIAQKSSREYTDKKRDEHEADKQHIKKSVAAYDLLCKLFPKDFIEIDCSRGRQMLSIVEVNNLIWETIKPLLPEPIKKGKAVVLRLDQPVDSGKPQKKSKKNNTGMESILLIQKQMLAKLATTREVNKQQLKKAISLLAPLHYRKSEIKELLNNIDNKKSLAGDEPVAVNKIIDQLVETIPARIGDEAVILRSAIPRNEFQLINEASSLNLNYRQKERALADKLQASVSEVAYRFEVTTDYATLLDFKNEVETKQLKISAANARLGYKIPKVIETYGYEEPYNKAFEISNKLYRSSASSINSDAIYSLLLGHNVRWSLEVTADALLASLKKSKNQTVIIFLGLLRDKIAEHHPHVARMLTKNT